MARNDDAIARANGCHRVSGVRTWNLIEPRRLRCCWIIVPAIASLLSNPGGRLLAAEPKPEKIWPTAAVAADHPLAGQAGVEIFQQGGNVVDAAVAVGFALSVLRPGRSGMGGGGFMVIWDASKRQGVALDYRERAPSRSGPQLFAKSPEASRIGGAAVGVPGHVRGLCHALQKYGSMSLREVLVPAMRYARNGVALVDAELDHRTRRKRRIPDAERFRHLTNLYLGGPTDLESGQRVTSPQLKALELLAESGAVAFYEGPIAHSIVDTVRAAGGVMTLDDLKRMDVVERSPLTGRLQDYSIVTMPPPSSGGVALIETANILDALERTKSKRPAEQLKHNSAKYLHVLTESLKHAFADRAEFLGDPDFVDVPVTRLTSASYAKVLAERIDFAHTQPPTSYGRYLPVEDAGTSHFSIIDRHGNAVACTETINTSYGSLLVDPKFGIVLNNEMDDFTTAAGRPNAFGLIQSKANVIEPRKKPLSSMTPTILVRNGKAVYAAGGSGGPKIISATIQVLLNMAVFEMSPREAVHAPRLHHQWLPDVLRIERRPFKGAPKIDPMIPDALKLRGHDIQLTNDGLANVQAVSLSKDGLRAASDPRTSGTATGY